MSGVSGVFVEGVASQTPTNVSRDTRLKGKCFFSTMTSILNIYSIVK